MILKTLAFIVLILLSQQKIILHQVILSRLKIKKYTGYFRVEKHGAFKSFYVKPSATLRAKVNDDPLEYRTSTTNVFDLFTLCAQVDPRCFSAE